MAFLIPSIIASYDSLEGGDVFEVAISLAYPVLTSVQLIPVILGISILGKKNLA